MKQEKIVDILKFLRRSKELESIKRYQSSLRGKQNTVAEHSWRIALMTFIIASECKVNMDLGHALGLALVHDLAEAKTGDVDAFDQIIEGKSLIKDKVRQEEQAIHEITDDLSFGDWIYSLWQEYEEQRTIEAKFIKALDKIEGFLHIAEGEVRMYIPREFHADYANEAVASFDEATRHFPELKDLLDNIKEDLKTQFDKAGVKWIDGTANTFSN